MALRGQGQGQSRPGRKKPLGPRGPPRARLVELLERARWALHDELNASGADEVRDHPTLRQHAKVFSAIERALAAERDARAYRAVRGEAGAAGIRGRVRSGGEHSGAGEPS